MLWRVSQKQGWVNKERGRRRQFDEEAIALENKIKKLQPQNGNLLGNAKADALLTAWVPNIASRLKP